MKNSNVSMAVFLIVFCGCLFFLYQLNDSSKTKDNLENPAQFDTSSVNSNSVEIPAEIKTSRDSITLPRDSNNGSDRSIESSARPVRPENSLFTKQSRRVEDTNRIYGSEEKNVAQQMAVRQKVSDKIVQSNMDRTQFELDRGAAALQRIRASHLDLR